MPMNAFLLQDIPVDVAEYAGRVARSARRGMNDVLVEMLARAIAMEEQARAAAIAPAPPTTAAAASSETETARIAVSEPTAAAAPPVAPEPIVEAAANAATPTAPSPPSAEPGEMDDPESLTLREAMLAAQSIPSG